MRRYEYLVLEWGSHGGGWNLTGDRVPDIRLEGVGTAHMLNSLGNLGWRLAGIARVPETAENYASDEYVFERELVEES